MTPQPEPVQIQQGDRVKARVIRLAPSGIVVRLESGQRGFVRQRELSWKRSSGGDERVIAVGDELELVVLQVGQPGESWELSLKRASGDPWEKVKGGKYRSGSIVQGEVVNLESYGAFVELEPGIDGLLSKSAIPGGKEKEIQDLLWIGDQVEVVITDIDYVKRLIGLSIVECLSKRQHIEEERSPGVIGSSLDAAAKSPALPSFRESDWAPGQRVSTVLVVDDDREFADHFAEWLRRLGFQVSTAYEGAEALAAVSSCNLVFLDLDLGNEDGLEIARQVSRQDSRIHIVLMTGLGWFDRGLEAVQDLEVGAVLLKPLDYGEVLHVLRLAANGELVRAKPQGLPVSESPSFIDRLSVVYQQPLETHQKLERVLDYLRSESGAKIVLLFAIDPPTQRVSVAAASGFDIEHFDQGELQPLRFSPVRNVALDGETIQEPEAPALRKFDKLLQLFFFESCVAVPVPAVGRDVGYALFLFDPDTERSLSAHQALAVSAAYFIAAAIHEERVRTLIKAAQKQVLLGQLASGLLHELGNHLGRIGQYAQVLDLDCRELAEASRSAPLLVWSGRMQRRVAGILDTTMNLKGIIADQLGLMGREVTQVVDVNALLDKTVRQIAPLARQHRVRVVPRFDARLPGTVAVSVELEQVFLNLALNAVQQMGTYGRRGGTLEISSQHYPRDGALPIKIRFSDEGPGIHRSLWDWIFEMGTSTRDGGTGLGLFISRNLIERMGGRLSVEQSRMFVGSTFLVELPVVTTKEAADV